MRLALYAALSAALLPAADFKAGLGRVAITPKVPIRMSGYAGRTGLSQGVVHDLWAKALALEDGKGSRVVLVTLDLITIPGPMADEIAQRVRQAYGLSRERLVLNVSHTHAGPVIRANVHSLPEAEGEAARVVNDYSRGLEEAIVRVVGDALKDLAPARLSFGHGRAGFAGNRRQFTPKGVIIGVNPDGPTDHDVPVLVIRNAGGRKIRGVLFGYACHNTTLGAKNYLISGDYAGFAQIEVEKRYPGATALFVQLCGADQNPQPRNTLELAEQHGKELGASVAAVAGGKMKRLRPPLRAAFEKTELVFPPHTRETFERRLNDKEPLVVQHAKRMLRDYDAGHPVRSIPFPVQAVRFGRDVVWVFIAGETLVDYSLRTKRELRGKDVMVAGYSNDVMCYIPSLRVLKEGGYEADRSLLYDGMPGPFAEDVEERVMAAVHRVVDKTGR